MKRMIAAVLLVLFFQPAVQAQAKQRKELLLQIAALQVYMDYAKKGYAAVSKGLNFIGDAKKGEVNLHGDYFTSLLKVNPRVRNYYKIGEIIALQLKILKNCKKSIAGLQTSDLFYGDELDYIERSFNRLFENCNRTLEELLVLTTDAGLELKDDQRIERIDALHERMLSDYTFSISFTNEARLLCISKAGDQKDAKVVKDIYGL